VIMVSLLSRVWHTGKVSNHTEILAPESGMPWFALYELRPTTAGAKPTCAGTRGFAMVQFPASAGTRGYRTPVGFALEKLRRTMPRRPPVTAKSGTCFDR